LEPEAELSGSMKKSKLIHSVLSLSGPPTLPVFFNLETKGMAGEFSRTKGSKTVEDLKKSLMTIVQLDFLQPKCDHSDVKRTIAIYGCHLF
jgi:hypothetical protein